jgi:hypothetical protein
VLLKATITRAHTDNNGIYGVRKVWLQLNRRTRKQPAYVAQLMRELPCRDRTEAKVSHLHSNHSASQRKQPG